MSLGYLYILSNPTMKGLLKVGFTKGAPEERARKLSVATGVAAPFTVEYFQISDDVEEVESLVHEEMMEYRVNENREFFEVSIEKAVSIIEKLAKDPVSSYMRKENECVCRRCGFQYGRTKDSRFCPKCGF